MRVLLAIGFVGAVLLLASCGGGDSSESASAQSNTELVAEVEAGKVPKVGAPSEPPPKKLVINDLEEGDGAELEKGDKFKVQYLGANYATGKPFEEHWGADATTFNFTDEEQLTKSWDIGLEGMKEGGLRELVVPASLGYGTGPLIYVIDMLEIE